MKTKETVKLLSVYVFFFSSLLFAIVVGAVAVAAAAIAVAAMYLNCFHVLSTSKNSFSFACVNIVRIVNSEYLTL